MDNQKFKLLLALMLGLFLFNMSSCSDTWQHSNLMETTTLPPEVFPTPLPTITPSHYEEIDGKLICDYWVSEDDDFRIFLTDLVTDVVEQLTYENGVYPKWSPDGKQIAFVSDRDGNPNIYLMNANGTSNQRLTDHPGYDAQMNWSPDGKQIAFVSDRDGNMEIYSLTLATGEISRLTYNVKWNDGEPVWSSDGRRIAFISETPNQGLMLYVMDANGENIQQIPPSKYGEFFRPAWCPEDRCLIYEHEVYSSRYPKSSKLFVYDFETGKERRLLSEFEFSTNDTHEWYASLSKDGQYILLWLIDDQSLLYALDMDNEILYSLRVEGGSCDLYH